MIWMKGLGISSVLILLIISTFSMVLQVGAQPTDTNVEELLKLAKEKLQQIKDYTNSNITLNQFSKHLSNITLSQEQVTEIEKDRSAIFVACIERITIQREQPGGLCDAFADYLMEKCKRFDNLLAYCTGQEVLPAIYGSKRLEQLSCIKNPPMYSDAEKIKSCINLVSLNSSYYDRQPLLLSTNSTKDKSDYDVTYHVQFEAKNTGINPITFENVTYAFYKDGEKLSSGCVGKPSGCRSPNSYTIPGLSSDNYQFDYTIGSNQTGVPPFVLNGTYYYGKALAEGTLTQEANTTIIAEPFTFVIY